MLNNSMQRRAIPLGTDFLTREIDGRRFIEGYFAVYGGRYELWDDAFETIDPGAFDLNRDNDVRALTNHDSTLVLGRTTAGTLTLRTDERGLWGSIEINGADQDAVNLYERVKRRDVTQCSFGFDIIEQDMIIRDDGVTVWHLKQVRLWEVSVCTFPAYPETEVTAISERKKELEEVNRRKTEKWKADMLAKLKGES